MSQQTISDIDLVPTEELVGRVAKIALHPDLRGHIIAVIVRNSGRIYEFEWYDDGLRRAEFYGFQLQLED